MHATCRQPLAAAVKDEASTVDDGVSPSLLQAFMRHYAHLPPASRSLACQACFTPDATCSFVAEALQD